MPKKLLFNFNREAIQNYTYVKYVGAIITATNTLEKPIKSAILKGSTKYRDIDTGEILEAFEEGRNLELVSVKMPVLTTSNVIHGVNFETIKINLSDGSFTLNNALNSSSGSVEYFDVSNLTNAKFVFRTTQAFERENYFTFFFYDKDMNYLKWVNGRLTKVADGVYSSTIPTVENAKYLRVTKYDVEAQMGDIVRNSTSAFIDNSVSFDSTFSIKTNILTVNEDVTLRSNGSVYDELDLLTGKLTQRIDENGEVLSQEIVKTVDLSILDQNENKVSSISSFNDTTHIMASSETIPPTFEGYLATKEVE